MKILLTGHHGYIGSVMSGALRNHEVVGLDCTYFGKDCAFGPEAETIPTIQKDLRDITASDVEAFDAVIHLGALSNDPLGNLKENWTYEINHLATVRLARLAK